MYYNENIDELLIDKFKYKNYNWDDPLGWSVLKKIKPSFERNWKP